MNAMNITPIMEALLAIVAAIFTVVVVPYIKSRTTAQQQQDINKWTATAVAAAEQVFSGTGLGKEKKAYVLNFLKEKGITLDGDALDAMIEAAVYKLKNGIIE